MVLSMQKKNNNGCQGDHDRLKSISRPKDFLETQWLAPNLKKSSNYPQTEVIWPSTYMFQEKIIGENISFLWPGLRNI